MTMAQETQNIQVGSQVQPRSLLTARRPSISVHNDTFSSFNSRDAIHSALRNETLPAIDSDEEDGKFRRSLQIDMKSLVGDSIGNVRLKPLIVA